MPVRIVFTALFMLFLIQLRMLAQQHDTIFDLTAFVYDDLFIPVPATHVINLNTHKGDVTDSLGIFRLPVHLTDTLLIRNIAFRDTLVPVMEIQSIRHIRLKRRHYRLQEVKIFEWGATYDDFREAFIEMPMQQNLGATLGLPRQDPDKVPLEMDEQAVKSAGLLLTSPVSFFYYNFNKHAKSARKVYWLKKNQEEHDQFDAIVSMKNLSDITGLTGVKLQEFQIFLSQRMVCDFNCSELAIYKEIYGLWKVYQELEERGMLIK
ncbi:MAG: hypothetical protein K8R52_09130 [Bacteroidales bacterium]|nr:hypothetical protein [Bacteroidales bacterium]